MTLEDEIVILKADRENLHQRVKELLAEIGTLRLQLATEKEITANLTWAIEHPVMRQAGGDGNERGEWLTNTLSGHIR